MKTIDIDTLTTNMQDRIEKAADGDNTLDRTVFYSSTAICAGLVGIAQALHAINENMKEYMERASL